MLEYKSKKKTPNTLTFILNTHLKFTVSESQFSNDAMTYGPTVERINLGKKQKEGKKECMLYKGVTWNKSQASVRSDQEVDTV